ncbi:18247_t:CDS:2, partial [Racocetra persica]
MRPLMTWLRILKLNSINKSLLNNNLRIQDTFIFICVHSQDILVLNPKGNLDALILNHQDALVLGHQDALILYYQDTLVLDHQDALVFNHNILDPSQ